MRAVHRTRSDQLRYHAPMEPPPRTAVYVARVHLALAAVVVVAGLIGGIALQQELWEPGGAGTGHRYARMLGMHSLLAIAIAVPTLAGCFGYLVVAELVGARRVIAPAVAWVGVGLWTIGLVATVVSLARPAAETGWTFYTPETIAPAFPIGRALGPLAFAAAGLVYAGHLGSVIVAAVRSAPPANLVVTAAFVGALVLACLASLRELFAIAPPMPSVLAATTFAALVLATAALARGVSRGPHALVAVIAVASAAVWSFTSLRVAGVATIGIWIWLVALGGFRRPVVAFVLLGMAPAILVHGVAGGIAYLTRDMHLHDTYFDVGRDHLLGAAVAFAGLAAVHAWSGPIGRIPHAIVAALGAISCSAGMLLHVSAALRLGASGMPRRYWDYDPAFTAGQQHAGFGAALVMVGVVLLVVAWAIGRAPAAVRADGSRDGSAAG